MRKLLAIGLEHLCIESSQAAQGVRDQAAAFGTLEQFASLGSVGTRGNGERGESGETRELRYALNAIQYPFDPTLESVPLETGRPAYGTERQDETVSDRGAQQGFWGPDPARPVELRRGAVSRVGSCGEATATKPVFCAAAEATYV